LLEHVYQAAARLSAERIYVVYGHGGTELPEALGQLGVRWVEQSRQLGTGHAVAQALPSIDPQATVLIVYGDVPLITTETLERLAAASEGGSLALLTAELDRPAGYGRIVRSRNGRIVRVVEERDATPEERAIREVNTGMMAVSAGWLKGWVEGLDPRNAQGEYYLTDVVAMAAAGGVPIESVTPGSLYEVLGVNDRIQLAEIERYYQGVQAAELMRAGVSLMDPARFDLRGELEAGQDCTIDVNVVLEGRVRIGDRVRIGPHCTIRDSEIGADATILSHCVIEGATIGAGARVGPYSRVRPETRLAEAVHVGNFVEIKKSSVGAGSKINHLSYIGDTEVGRDVNIGAGTITCNYDGADKHKTVIGDQAFIGSNTALVAPVEVGEGATIGAGTTLAQDAPPGALTLGRAAQTTVPGWQQPKKKS
jgi:bifunctional UDP-N-acetylglucosamine pyrophosphorylase/glucosamine-1-phosphate N-acetyltransferase